MKNILSLLLTIGCIFAQTNPVKMSVESIPKVRAGEVAEIVISMNMDDEWHIYSIFKTSASAGPLPTEVSVGGNAVGMVAPVIEPEPINAFDPGFETDTYYHKGNTQFTVPVKLKRNLQPGTYKIAVDVFYMVCNARLCYPPMTKTDTVVVEIEPGSPRADKLSFAVATSSPNDIGPLGKASSLLGIFLLAVGGAILSWVMPCVYPMIPIIISFFGKMSEEKHIGKNMIASFYGLGIAGTFVLIGILVGFLSWGVSDVAAQSRYANIGNFIATNSWINLGLGILFIFFAL